METKTKLSFSSCFKKSPRGPTPWLARPFRKAQSKSRCRLIAAEAPQVSVIGAGAYGTPTSLSCSHVNQRRNSCAPRARKGQWKRRGRLRCPPPSSCKALGRWMSRIAVPQLAQAKEAGLKPIAQALKAVPEDAAVLVHVAIHPAQVKSTTCADAVCHVYPFPRLPHAKDGQGNANKTLGLELTRYCGMHSAHPTSFFKLVLGS